MCSLLFAIYTFAKGKLIVIPIGGKNLKRSYQNSIGCEVGVGKQGQGASLNMKF